MIRSKKNFLIMFFTSFIIYHSLSFKFLLSEPIDSYQKTKDNNWYHGATMYEVMVRSFFDSNNDGIGDINGLIQKLDYLNSGKEETENDLKVDALWLMPIFKSPSYHGYDTTDYYQIDPVYGTLEDFKVLVKEAHKRDIKIILDLVLNHTSNQHPWFVKAQSSKNELDKKWYVWSSEAKKEWERPWGGGPVWHKASNEFFYGLFWSGMPDLNYNHLPLQEEMIKIGKYWIEQGADGYRLDAIRYLFETEKGKQADLPQTHEYLQRFAKEIHNIKPSACLIGEIWTDAQTVSSYYGNANELDLAFDFDTAGAIIKSIQDSNSVHIVQSLQNIKKYYKSKDFTAPFLANHDMMRLATQLNGNKEQQKIAAEILLSLPGTPFIYQGEEIGLQNGPKAGDEGKRTPMQWDNTKSAGFSIDPKVKAWNDLSGNMDKISVSAQENNPNSILSTYKNMVRLRKNTPALKLGELKEILHKKAIDRDILQFIRKKDKEEVLCIFHLGKDSISSYKIEFSASSENYTSAIDLKTKKTYQLNTNSDGKKELIIDKLEIYSSMWLALK